MADVLTSGNDRPPRPFPRRTALVVGAALLAVAVVAGVLELRERRAAAALDRRLDRVVDLDAEPRSSSSSYDPVSRSVRLDVQVQLRNDGPRDVVVERGRAGAYALVHAVVEVPAGRAVPLLLRRTLTCSANEPPPPAPLDVLVLGLRTAAGPRTAALPLDRSLVTDDAPRACGFLPLEEALAVEVREVRRSERGVLVSLALTSSSARPLTLDAVRGGGGLSVSAAPLPLVLPSQGELGPLPRVVQVVVSVGECRAARSARPQLLLRVRDDRGRVAQPVVGYEPALLSGLLADSCAG